MNASGFERLEQAVVLCPSDVLDGRIGRSLASDDSFEPPRNVLDRLGEYDSGLICKWLVHMITLSYKDVTDYL